MPAKRKALANATTKRAQPSLEDEVQSALTWLKRHSSKKTRDGMARYAIPSDNALWSGKREEFVKRAAFALLWGLTVHDKLAADEQFAKGLLFVEDAATDERHFVKKAVNMALRAIGKSNPALNDAAVAVARRLAASPEAAAQWVGKDALRELTSPSVTRRLAARTNRA